MSSRNAASKEASRGTTRAGGCRVRLPRSPIFGRRAAHLNDPSGARTDVPRSAHPLQSGRMRGAHKHVGCGLGHDLRHAGISGERPSDEHVIRGQGHLAHQVTGANTVRPCAARSQVGDGSTDAFRVGR